jgi:hypothetical protein
MPVAPVVAIMPAITITITVPPMVPIAIIPWPFVIAGGQRNACQPQRCDHRDFHSGDIAQRLWFDDARASLIDRHAGADGKDQDRHDECPEIKLAAVTERMGAIGSTGG